MFRRCLSGNPSRPLCLCILARHMPNPWLDPAGFAACIGQAYDPQTGQFIQETRRTGAEIHDDSPAHKRWAKRKMCPQCAAEFEQSDAYKRWNNLS